MGQVVSKASFQDRAPEYLRQVEATGEELIITDQGKPVLRVVPYRPDPMETLRSLRGSVLRYDDPSDPVGLEDWESLR
jgi:prevent-host-death family protein